MKDVFEYIAALLILFAATIGTAFRQEITQWGGHFAVWLTESRLTVLTQKQRNGATG